jgi:hypothetical protein
MTTDLVIEQDAGLNRHVLDLSPITWPQRREWMKQGLFLVPFSFWGMTMLVINQWMEDRQIGLLPLLAGFLTVTGMSCLGIAVLLEWTVRHERQASRKLKVLRNRIVRSGRKVISWKAVAGWHFAPVMDGANLQKLTILLRGHAVAAPAGRWSIVIAHPQQADAIRSLLDERNRTGAPGALLLHDLPSPRSPSGSSMVGLYVMAIGAMISGFAVMGLVGATLFLERENLRIVHAALHEPVEGNFNSLLFSVMRHFHSTHEFAWYLIGAGLLGCLAGYLLFRVGDRLISRKRAG